jgi:hypothetical protein
MVACEKCGKKGKGEIWSCSHRDKDDCPFLRSQEKLFPPLGLMVLFIAIAGFGLFLIGGLTFLIEGEDLGLILSMSCFLPLILSSLLAIMLGVILIFGVRERLDDTSSGASLQKVWFWGCNIYEVTKSALEVMEFQIETYPSIGHPASILAILLHPPDSSPRSLIYWNKYASEILITSIVHLIAMDRLVVRSSLCQRTFLGERIVRKPGREYFLISGRGKWEEEVKGEFESRIMNIVKTWPLQKASRHWSHGITPYRLTIELIGKIRWNPGRWIFQRIKQEAEMYELPEANGTTQQLRKEGISLENEVAQVSKSYPDFTEALRADLRSALSQMEWKYEGEP